MRTAVTVTFILFLSIGLDVFGLVHQNTLVAIFDRAFGSNIHDLIRWSQTMVIYACGVSLLSAAIILYSVVLPSLKQRPAWLRMVVAVLIVLCLFAMNWTVLSAFGPL